MLLPKNKPLRDPEWLRYLHTQPCVITHKDSSVDPAHIRWGLGGGVGLKPPDNRVLPILHEIHAMQDIQGEVAMWRAHLTDELMMQALIALAEKKYQEWKKS